MASGKDGFDAFLDPGVIHISGSDEDVDIRQILSEFLYKFQQTGEALDKENKFVQ